MKKITFLFLLSLTTLTGFSQVIVEGPAKGLGFGFQLNQYQRDFGLGLTVTSPYVFNKTMAFRMRANYMYYEHPDVFGFATWTPYYNVQFGVVGGSWTMANFLRLYGEGGVVMLLPDAEFSSESTNIGGYGVFGFEFFMDKHNNYFIELGGMGTGATADRIAGSPIYSNGFTISVGYRVVL